MKNVDDMEYYPVAESLVNILCKKTQNKNKIFFRILIAYHFTKIASMMRCNIRTHDRGDIPVSLYAINLAPSGQSKGHSTNIIEDFVIDGFRKKFLKETFLEKAKENIEFLSIERSIEENISEERSLDKTIKEFESLGELVFSFDSGTAPAVKQMRHKLLMSKAGSMNMEIDEIGSNLLNNTEVMRLFFELFDVGKIKQKLIKNTSDNIRNKEIFGRTPTNMMLFGTPVKLMDGGKIEEEFISVLETGMARRCFFGLDNNLFKSIDYSPSEIYDMMTDENSTSELKKLSRKLKDLADISFFENNLTISKEVSLLLIEYRLLCDKKANELKPHEEIKKTEISHRYFKVLKLAGTYAFIDKSPEVTKQHIYYAIKLAEDSGSSLHQLLTRDRNYVKLAKYISNTEVEITHADIIEDLPFYKGSESQRKDMLNLAIAYGYKNNIIIKQIFRDGVEFLKGESLEETDIKEIIISYSTHVAYRYKNEIIPFNKITNLTQASKYHWIVHHLEKGHRCDKNIKKGFNLIVLDVDGGISINSAISLMSKYTYLIYTTKRHTKEINRFRIILPMSHKLYLTKSEYADFMKNIYEWIPFDLDEDTFDRCRKWLSSTGDSYQNNAELINALNFIPKTRRNDEIKKQIVDSKSLSNIERWFCNNIGIGNRSNQLIKYALMLVDSGLGSEAINNKIINLNNKIANKISQNEIMGTIMITANKAILKRESNK